jgi:hypothetical protein
MWPEWAALGTVSTSPAFVLRRCEPGDVRPMRAPGARGNAIVIPEVRPLPAISSVPCVDTWCGLPLHLGCGTQLTLVMRIVVTWGLVAVFVFVEAGAELLGAGVVPGAAAVVVAPEPPVEATPPALAAAVLEAVPTRLTKEHDSAANDATARRLKRSPDRLWAALIAKTIPSTAGKFVCPIGGVRG